MRSTSPLHLLIPTLLLYTLPFSLATLQCHLPVHLTFPSHPRPPSPDDCRRILAHIPTLPNDPTSPQPSLLFPSHPFLPTASFVHRSCRIAISYVARSSPSDPHDASFDPYLDFFLRRAGFRKPATPLPELAIGQVWTLLREAAERIVEQCVAQGRTGVDVGPLGIPELQADARYFAEVASAGDQKLETYQAVMSGVAALQGVVLPSDGKRWIADLFQMTTFRV